MKKLLFLYVYFTLSFTHNFLGSVVMANTNISTDENALLALRAHISFGPNHILATNWSAESLVCNWIGVTCGSRHYRVRKLNISYMGIAGTIPPQLGKLSFLVALNLHGNNFHGNLPPELAGLRRLKLLDLGANQLSGTIPPQLGNFSFLVSMDLSGNNFQGELPQEFTRLHRLKLLNLGANALGGEIPSWFGHLNQLEYLYLFNNSFTGSIPVSISNMSNLKELFFGENQLSGSIPFGIFNISTLERVLLQGNGLLSGGLPDDICRSLQSLNYLSVSGNMLSGPLPSTWSQCLQLQQLYLGSNNFSGVIPKDVCNLKVLQVLHLAGNKLEGTILEGISNLTNLRMLSLSENHLTGVIPEALSNLKNLRELYLSDNSFTGVLPKEIGNLTMLTHLNLHTNNLGGAIPLELGNLNYLEYLNLDNNSFTDPIPEALFNISTMRIISLSNNHLSGKLPSTMGYRLPNLEELYLASNNLIGTIPPTISNSSTLRILELGSNHFTGTIPNSLGNLRSLKVLNLGGNVLSRDSSAVEMEFLTSLSNCDLSLLGLSYNPLNGVLPKSIGNLSKTIERLYMAHCGIFGDIPAEIGSLTSLTFLFLDYNQLTGRLPNSIISMQQIQILSCSHNRLSGIVSNSLCGLERLGELILLENMFSGPLPECIGNLTSLRKLWLNNNRWNSVIPDSLWNLKDLLALDLSSNFLSGSLSANVGNLKVVEVVNLAMNNLSGDLPDTIGSLQNLRGFSLARNLFEGSVPDSVGNMLGLETLDLSRNKFSGKIPLSLEKLPYLKHLNVSYNNLTGLIPSKGPFVNLSSDSFMFNNDLCGEKKFQVPPCLDLSPRRSWIKEPRHILLLSLSLLAFIGVSALVVVYLIRRKKKIARVKEELSPLAGIKRISYYELREATEIYDERNLLGKGSFGSVYKGTLRDGQVIAVKVFNVQIERALKSFDVECEMLRNLRHRNLTKVISSCSNDDFKALVLEFMPNGNLESWLHSGNHFLNITERLSIMIDVAYALQYLHSGYSMTVVHSDLKPSNVLLDTDMVAHVSDFGIAKMLGEESIDYTNTLATFGYIAPEYGSEGLVSTKCDVYSYGIMLMEVFTSKRPDDNMFDENLTLKDWVNQSVENALSEVIDDRLMQRVEEEHLAVTLECLSTVMHVALNCAKAAPKERSDIGDVLASLNKIKLKLSEAL